MGSHFQNQNFDTSDRNSSFNNNNISSRDNLFQQPSRKNPISESALNQAFQSNTTQRGVSFQPTVTSYDTNNVPDINISGVNSSVQESILLLFLVKKTSSF